jgi:CYTH domain-containing protein
MALEIERKFLVKNDSFKTLAVKATFIEQGYLMSEGENIVRIRIADDTAVVTIKSKSNKHSIARCEWEYAIPLEGAREMMNICDSNIIRKTRYLVPAGKHIFEVDVFHGDNEGLVIAEVELSAEDELFNCPDWLGEEVTAKKCYYNTFIARHPLSELDVCK